jgi:peptide deformylase
MLCYYGNPILRKRAQEISEITDEIRALANLLVEKMHEYDGIGLAAPQIGVLKRIFVIRVISEDAEGEVVVGEPRVFINPILSHPSEELVERNEACLSIPKLSAPVLRPLTIDIEATNVEGERFTLRGCWGFLARVMMHENDHLNGVLFIDHIKGKRRTQLDPVLRRIKREYTL